MTVSKTSVAWAFWANLRQALNDAEWPGEKPHVISGDLASREINMREVVAIARMSSEQNWGPMGQFARDEMCRFTVEMLTAVPGQSDAQQVARLGEMVRVLELAIRPATTMTVEQLTLSTPNLWSSELAGFSATVQPVAAFAQCTVLVKGRI